MEVSCIEAEEDLIFDGVAHVEFVGADDVGFGADAEEFGFYGVAHVCFWEFFREDGVEGFFEALARGEAIDGCVFVAVWYPDVHDGWGAELFADVCGNFAGALAVFDPEVADGFFRVGEGEAVGSFGVSEAGGVEVDAHFVGLGPVDPVFEVGGFDLVAVDFFSGEFAVEGVEVEAVFTGDEGEGFVEVGAEFVGCACFAGVVAGDGDAAGEGLGSGLEAAYIIALPAVEGDGDFGQFLHGEFGIDSEFGVAVFGVLVIRGGGFGGFWHTGFVNEGVDLAVGEELSRIK